MTHDERKKEKKKENGGTNKFTMYSRTPVAPTSQGKEYFVGTAESFAFSSNRGPGARFKNGLPKQHVNVDASATRDGQSDEQVTLLVNTARARLAQGVDSHCQARGRARVDIRRDINGRNELRRLKEEYLAALRQRTDARAHVVAEQQALFPLRNPDDYLALPRLGTAVAPPREATTEATRPQSNTARRSTAHVPGPPPTTGFLDQRRPAEAAPARGATIEAYNPSPRYRVGRQGNNDDAHVVLLEHLALLRQGGESDGNHTCNDAPRPHLAVAALTDVACCAEGLLGELLVAIRDEVVRSAFSENLLASTTTTTVQRAATASAVPLRHHPTANTCTEFTTFVARATDLERQLADATRHNNELRLRLQAYDTAAHVHEQQKAVNEKLQSEQSDLQGSLLAENRQLRTQLRDANIACREAVAEARYYNGQSAELQKTLKATLDRLYALATQQHAVARGSAEVHFERSQREPTSLEKIIMASNQDVLRVLSIAFLPSGDNDGMDDSSSVSEVSRARPTSS